jgi:hypothetical protein
LGHVDGDNFVASDATGRNTLFTISLKEVEDLAAAAGCDTVLLGCGSALAGTPIGVNKPFNPVDAVGRLNKALMADNYLDFVRTLSNEDMGLVFTDTAFDRTTRKMEAEVYAREQGDREPVIREKNLAGRVGMVFGIGSSGISGSGGNDNNNGGSAVGGNGTNSGGSNANNSGGSAPNGGSQIPSQSNGGSNWLYPILGVVLVIFIVFVLLARRARSA